MFDTGPMTLPVASSACSADPIREDAARDTTVPEDVTTAGLFLVTISDGLSYCSSTGFCRLSKSYIVAAD